VRLVFAYSDAIGIFLNGRPLFDGESASSRATQASSASRRSAPDAIYLDLVAGTNELVFAVAETFGGWGFSALIEGTDPASW
jgi:hypothetical protein